VNAAAILRVKTKITRIVFRRAQKCRTSWTTSRLTVAKMRTDNEIRHPQPTEIVNNENDIYCYMWIIH